MWSNPASPCPRSTTRRFALRTNGTSRAASARASIPAGCPRRWDPQTNQTVKSLPQCPERWQTGRRTQRPPKSVLHSFPQDHQSLGGSHHRRFATSEPTPSWHTRSLPAGLSAGLRSGASRPVKSGFRIRARRQTGAIPRSRICHCIQCAPA